MVELDIVGGCGAGDETDGFPDDEGNSFRLGFAHSLRGGCPAFGLVEEFMRLC